uniref:Uncharacterized protein n=1 Tax=Arundo donax TaxID=35708 RepID=A0A0A8ZN62_ARUDO
MCCCSWYLLCGTNLFSLMWLVSGLFNSGTY